MEDLIWDAASAFCASIVWFLLGRRRLKKEQEEVKE